MKTQPRLEGIRQTDEQDAFLIEDDLKQKIIKYYSEAGMDYGSWSSDFNMHFGFGGWSDIFCRERMLNRMNDEVFVRLKINERTRSIVDFGCGVGSTMRRGTVLFEQINFTGLTIVPWQTEKGRELNKKEGKEDKIEFQLEDYHGSSLPSEIYDGLYAIESACYSPQLLQPKLVSEMYRVLSKGGRLVIVDGFRRKNENEFGPLVNWIYTGICTNWALPGMMHIDELKENLSKTGFKNIQVENISWKVAPSVLHVPFVIIRFLIQKKWRGENLSLQSLRNLKGAFQTMLLGLHQRAFGYYIVSGEK